MKKASEKGVPIINVGNNEKERDEKIQTFSYMRTIKSSVMTAPGPVSILLIHHSSIFSEFCNSSVLIKASNLGVNT